jgi:hypothetical protein
MRRTLFAFLVTATLASCGDRSSHVDTSSDSAASYAPPSPGATAPRKDTARGIPTGKDFERAAYHDYALAGTALPKRISDSILKSVDLTKPNAEKKLETAMADALKHHDITARQKVAAAYGITLDSLQKILDKGNKEKW